MLNECPYIGWDLYIEKTWEELAEEENSLLDFYTDVIDVMMNYFAENASSIQQVGFFLL